MKKILIAVAVRLVSFCISVLALIYLLIKRWSDKDFFYVKPRPLQPEILNDRRWGNHGLITLPKQKIKLHYVEKGTRSNPLIVCLHGFPDCWFSWRHQLEQLSSKYWVVAVDMRGYGDSDKPSRKSDYATENLVADMKEFIEVISNGEKCILMAHDWGGAIAWHLVSSYPEMFKNHISINGPYFKAFSEVLNSSFSQLKKSWYMCFFQSPYIPEMYCSAHDMQFFNELSKSKGKFDENPEEVAEALKYYFSKKNGWTAPINYYRNIDFGASYDSCDKKIDVPTLIIWGKNDIALDESIPKLTTKYCSDIQLKFIDGTGHWAHEEEVKYVNEQILEYLS